MNQINMHFTYSVLSCNVRGLGQTEKCDAVRDTISVSCPHIACLQETKLSSLTQAKSRAFLPPFLSEFISVLAAGSRGGLSQLGTLLS